MIVVVIVLLRGFHCKYTMTHAQFTDDLKRILLGGEMDDAPLKDDDAFSSLRLNCHCFSLQSIHHAQIEHRYSGPGLTFQTCPWDG